MSRWGPGYQGDGPYPTPPSGGQQFLESFTDALLSGGQRIASEHAMRLENERRQVELERAQADLAGQPAEDYRRGQLDVIDATAHGFRTPQQAAATMPVEAPQWNTPALPANATPNLPRPTPAPQGFGAPGIETRTPAALGPVNSFADALDERDQTVMGRPQVNVGGQSLVYSPEAVNEELWGRPMARGNGLTFEQRMALENNHQDRQDARTDVLVTRAAERQREMAILKAKGMEATDAYRQAVLEMATINAQLRLAGIDLGLANQQPLAEGDATRAAVGGATAEARARLKRRLDGERPPASSFGGGLAPPGGRPPASSAPAPSGGEPPADAVAAYRRLKAQYGNDKRRIAQEMARLGYNVED